MPRTRDVTPVTCPICGLSDAPAPTSCTLCDGTKQVDAKTWARWALRPSSKSTSTTINMRAIAVGRVLEVIDSQVPGAAPPGAVPNFALLAKMATGITDATAARVVRHGLELIAVLDSWNEAPAYGPERGAHYKEINGWLKESGDFLVALRAARASKR